MTIRLRTTFCLTFGLLLLSFFSAYPQVFSQTIEVQGTVIQSSNTPIVSINSGGDLGRVRIGGFSGDRTSGSVSIRDGARLTASSIITGFEPGASGFLNVDGFGSHLSLDQLFNGVQGGVGQTNLTGGSSAQIDFIWVGDFDTFTGARGIVNIVDVGTSVETFFLRIGQGELNVSNGAQLRSFDDLQFGSSGTLVKPSSITIDDAQWDHASEIDLVGNDDADVLIDLQVKNGGVINARSVFAGQNASVVLKGGRLNLEQNVVVGNGAALSGYGEIIGGLVVDAGRLSIDEAQNLTVGSTVLQSSTALSGNNGWVVNGGKIENRGILESVSFQNEGLYVGRNSALVSSFNLNAGALDFVQGFNSVEGDLVNQADGRISASNDATVVYLDDVINNGNIRTFEDSDIVFLGDVEGTGSFSGTGDVFFVGGFSPGNSPALINFEGNLEFADTSTTLIELGGRLRGDEYDAFDVSGQLLLDGDLSIVLLNDFVPQVGDVFDIFNAGAVGGMFGSVILPDLVGREFDLSQLNSREVVSVVASVPEPTSFLLLFLAGLVLSTRRRHVRV